MNEHESCLLAYLAHANLPLAVVAPGSDPPMQEKPPVVGYVTRPTVEEGNGTKSSHSRLASQDARFSPQSPFPLT